LQDNVRSKMLEGIADFRMPGYNEIPDVGLFLDQTAKYISGVLAPLDGITVTGSMISNYVKKDLIDNPVKKQYDRDQIAYLIFIAVAKSMLPLESIKTMIDMQKRTYEARTAYEYFCREFENILLFAFGAKDTLEEVGKSNSDQKIMLRNTIIAVVHKIYLDRYIAICREAETQKPES